MGSTLMFDSDRRERLRERREAQLARDLERRQAAHTTEPHMSPAQRLADQQIRAELDRIVACALERHEQRTAGTGEKAVTRDVASTPNDGAGVADRRSVPTTTNGSERRPAAVPPGCSELPVARRDQDITVFRERRQHAADEARREARARIARAGEPAAVTDALAAITPTLAPWWRQEHEQLERALHSGRTAKIGAAAREALWAISRDAARQPRTGRDPELALAMCVAYAIIVQLPRTALRSTERTRPDLQNDRRSPRVFWR